MFKLIALIILGILLLPISFSIGMIFLATLMVSYFVIEVCGYGKRKNIEDNLQQKSNKLSR